MAPLCIYCREPLSQETAWAHVIPKSFGGRLQSNGICCTECNNAMSPLENDLCSALRECSAALAARDADNKPIRAIVEADGEHYDYGDGVGEQQIPAPVFKHGKLRKLIFPIPGDAENVVKVIAHHLWRAGVGVEALDDGRMVIEPDKTFNVRPHAPERKLIFTTLKLGTVKHMRVLMKMALELLAYLLPEDARRWGVLRPARRLVRYGEEADTLPVKFESLSSGAGLFRPEELPQLAHAVEVWTSGTYLLYRVTFFGGLHVTGTLTDRWNGPPLSIAHALDPRQPARVVTKHAPTDGPPLGLYHPGLKEEALRRFGEWFKAQTLEISAEVIARPWEPPRAPDLVPLRPAIEKRLAELLTRKKQPPSRKKRDK